MKNTNTFFCLFSFVALLASCSDRQSDGDKIITQEHKSGIEFPDATEFLPDWPRQNSLVVMITSDPSNLQPFGATGLNAITIHYLTHGFLLLVDLQKPGLVPMLAKSLPIVSADGLQYTYELLDEAEWDDGSPVTVEDVLFTIKANKCPLTNNPLIKPYMGNIKTMVTDAANPKKFTLVMKRTYVENINLVTNFPIISKKYFDPQNILSKYTFEQFDDSTFKADGFDDLNKWSLQFNDGKYGSDPQYLNGAGPYKVASWDHGSSVLLQRKANHWTSHLKKPNIYLSSYPDQIIFKVVKDENAQMLEFKSQTIDASNILSSKVLLELQKDSLFNLNYHSAFLASYSMNYIALNMHPDGLKHKRIFDDLNVRKAMARLIPVDKIISVVAMGQAMRWPSMVSPLKPDYNKDLTLIPFDVEGAKKLLDDAGWKDSDSDGIRDKTVDGEKISLEPSFTFGVQGNLSKDIVNMIVEAASQAGVKIIPQSVDAPVLMQNLHDHDFDMVMAGWGSSSLLQDYSQLWHTSAWSLKGSNFSGFGDASSDALLDSIKYTLDDSLRHEMSRRLQKMVYDAQPYIFLYSTYKKVVIHKRWGNQIMTAEMPSIIINNLKLLAPGNNAALLKKSN